MTYITDNDPTKKTSSRVNILAEMEVRQTPKWAGGRGYGWSGWGARNC